MRRLCERPGCSQPADVVYRIEPDQLSVWLGRAAVVDGEPQPNMLCRRHADAMIVPLGWSLDDQREPVPQLFRPADPVAVVSGPRPGRRHRPRDQAALSAPAQLAFGDAPAGGEQAGDEQAGDEQAGDEHRDPPEVAAEAGWQPVFDQDDDLGGLLRAESPLLARAFGGRPRPPKRP